MSSRDRSTTALDRAARWTSRFIAITTHDCLSSTPLSIAFNVTKSSRPQGVCVCARRRQADGLLLIPLVEGDEARHNRARRRPPAIERGRRERFGVQRESCVVVVVVVVADVRQKRVVDVPETSFAFASSRRRRLRLHGELRKGFEDW